MVAWEMLSKMKNNLSILFKNKGLLDHALTHKSWVNEHKGIRSSNERLEFLGDAVLELVVTEILYSRFPGSEEGYLTELRSNIVNTRSLASVAKALGVDKIILLSKGEEDGGGRSNTSLLANCTEAIIGSLYLDSGMEATRKFIVSNLLSDLDRRAKTTLKDNKSLLQEQVQSAGLTTPKYNVVKESGPDHAKIFSIEVTVEGKVWGRGEGKSKSSAEQLAAQQALKTHPIAKSG